MSAIQPLSKLFWGSTKHVDKCISRNQAHAILDEWVQNERLKLHSMQVAHLMSEWAKENECADECEIEKWYLAGLLHDADWEKYPTEHCEKILTYLEKEYQLDPDILNAIASHSPRYFGKSPEKKIEKMIYVFDELIGLIHAYSLMRKGYQDMEIGGVKKKLQDKKFAAGVNRDDIQDALEIAQLAIDDVIQFIIQKQSEFMNEFKKLLAH